MPKLSKAEYQDAELRYNERLSDPDFPGRSTNAPKFKDLSVVAQMKYSANAKFREEAAEIERGRHLLEGYQERRVAEIDQKISAIDLSAKTKADKRIIVLQTERNKLKESIEETKNS